MILERLALVALAPLAGCSALLSFDPPPDGPPDAPPDAVFTQAECDYKEPNDSLETAALVVPGDVGPAAICAGGETDYYRFTVPAGATSVTVRINFVNRPSGDIDLRLLDADGTMVAQSRGFGDVEQISCPGTSPACPTLAAGDYVFQVFPAFPASVNRYDLALEIAAP